MDIALDFDDVICGFTDGVRDAVRHEFGVDVPITQWDLSEILNPIVGQDWFSGWLRERPERWTSFPAIDGAIGGIAQLRRDGHYIEVVTAKPEWAEFVIWEWFGIHRPAVNRVTIVDIGVPKTEASDADLLVDDNVGNIEQWLNDGRDAVLYSQAHNSGRLSNAPRVANWKELVELIRMEEAVRL